MHKYCIKNIGKGCENILLLNVIRIVQYQHVFMAIGLESGLNLHRAADWGYLYAKLNLFTVL